MRTRRLTVFVGALAFATTLQGQSLPSGTWPVSSAPAEIRSASLGHLAYRLR